MPSTVSGDSAVKKSSHSYSSDCALRLIEPLSQGVPKCGRARCVDRDGVNSAHIFFSARRTHWLADSTPNSHRFTRLSANCPASVGLEDQSSDGRITFRTHHSCPPLFGNRTGN